MAKFDILYSSMQIFSVPDMPMYIRCMSEPCLTFATFKIAKGKLSYKNDNKIILSFNMLLALARINPDILLKAIIFHGSFILVKFSKLCLNKTYSVIFASNELRRIFTDKIIVGKFNNEDRKSKIYLAV